MKNENKLCPFFKNYAETTTQWRRSERIVAKISFSLPQKSNKETVLGLYLAHAFSPRPTGDEPGLHYPCRLDRGLVLETPPSHLQGR